MAKPVSRAFQKLEYALTYFKLVVKDKICADFGSSTGGFVQVLLEQGASKVYAVDTAYGELAWTLRQDSRVVVLERTNAIHVTLTEPVDFISIDVSFTKQKFVVPNALKNLKTGGHIVSLLKPHYEADKHELVKGKVLDEYLPGIVARVINELKSLQGINRIDYTQSPIEGLRAGNKEFLLFLQKP